MELARPEVTDLPPPLINRRFAGLVELFYCEYGAGLLTEKNAKKSSTNLNETCYRMKSPYEFLARQKLKVAAEHQKSATPRSTPLRRNRSVTSP